MVATDLSFNLPVGTYGRIAPRSGLAWYSFIDIGAGVIDRDYTGNVYVLMFNHSDTDFSVSRGDKIAPLICEQAKCPDAYEFTGPSLTVRGESGFKSTGMI